MTDDIVARLRVWSRWLDERVPDSAVGDDLRGAADEIERVRAERDNARFRFCLLRWVADRGRTISQYAAEMGWQLPKEMTDED